MATRYLLDTNMLSDVIRNRDGNVARRMASLPPAERSGLMTSIVVAGELRFGAEKKGSAALSERVERLLESLPVLPLDAEVDRQYARIRAMLEKQGTPIGGNDLWIAAHAVTLDAVLVTDNTDEFRRVGGLRVENWMRNE